MEELALQKLNAVAAKYAGDWKWTAAQTEFTWMDQQNYLVADCSGTRRVHTTRKPAALNESRAAHRGERASRSTIPTLDSERRRGLWDAITREQNRYAEIERARADRDEFDEPVHANAGVIVALDRDGNLDISPGPSSVPRDAAAYRCRARAGGNGSDGVVVTSERRHGRAPGLPDGANNTSPGKKNGGYTDALAERPSGHAHRGRAPSTGARSRGGPRDPHRVRARPLRRLRPPPAGLRAAGARAVGASTRASTPPTP